MADPRRKDAICTYSGKVIRPLDPNPNDISIEDIAHSLSNQCRFTGHTSEFYSVAQHSVLVSDYIYEREPGLALCGLLHDASEAYLSDIARPIKRYKSEFAEDYADIEIGLMVTIADKFDFPFPLPEEVMRADLAVFNAEVRDLMPENTVFDRWVVEETEEMQEPIVPWTPEAAKDAFLWTFSDLEANGIRQAALSQ